ncbi:U6 snRNA phosphodiesterase 1 [Episyrphus balteatus]|uniref:U6 snRNA phosphodiesterase 1 n=1 Tax=Episyrphus balteatus TaxID=286459 RepID=UPI002486CAB9|nr:U6 snRNA phosphodiesterase 1 [Episyrphus balteatus]
MALVNYSSSSDDDEEDNAKPPEPKIMKISPIQKLPLPSAISSMNKVFHVAPEDDPSKHGGRIRSFEHERGNWATLIFIPVDLNIMDELQMMIQNALHKSIDLKQSENIHLSLTKTVILRHHWIKLFVKSLQETLVSSEHFPVEFQSLNVYLNEERTRTFIGLTVGDVYFEKLHKLMLKMDKLMNEFQLNTFYENPSFHASIMWCLGDQESLIKEKLPELNAKLSEMRETNADDFQIKVNQIKCNTGNKSFNFELK